MFKARNQLIVFILFTTSFSYGAFGRFIVFGDSLSDTGTYFKAVSQYQGGKFTTNPSKIWVELIAESYQLSAKPNRHDGFGQPVELLGGFNFAQGGARITNPSGNGSDKGYSTRPLSEQLSYFENSEKTFKADDLIFVQGGANDILVLLTEVSQNKKTPQQAIEEILVTANQFVDLIKQIQKDGASQVVVLNLPQIEKTPKVITLDPQVQALVKKMTLSYNKILSEKLKDLETVKIIDLYSFDDQFNLNYQSYGFKNITTPACKLDALPIKSSLTCTTSTLIEESADKTFKFADSIHPTGGFSEVIAQFVLSQLQVK